MDFDIAALGGQAFVNAKEIAGNGKDDDGNGHVDDVNGIGWTLYSDYTTDLLFPIRTRVTDPLQYQQYSKGLSDLRASVDSEEASALKKKLSALPKDDYQPFIEGLSAYGSCWPRTPWRVSPSPAMRARAADGGAHHLRPPDHR